MTTDRPKFSITPEWPPALPDHCDHCGNRFDIRFALEIGPSRLGRFLRKIAPWMTIVMLLLMFATKLSFLGLGGNGGVMAFALALILPSILLWMIGGLLPTKARLYCFKCDRSHFYHPLRIP
jgi:hypothetical protein